MRFESVILNELPFMIELQDGTYEVNTNSVTVALTFNSDWYKLHTAQFAEYAGKTIYVGNKDTLQNIIEERNISNYAFGQCKTFVSCTFSKEYIFSNDDYDAITEEQCIDKTKSLLIRQNIKYENVDILHNKACLEFAAMTPDQKIEIKKRILIDNTFRSLHNVYVFYEALNLFLRQYSYIRSFFWIQKLDENTLEGTLIKDILDGSFYDSITFAGLAPSVLPYKRIFSDLEADKLEDLINRLKNTTEIPVEEELILVARSLWYRLEYRSAVIESSAALEITVEKKLIEKMTTLGMSQQNIEIELKKTENNFNQRCDHFLNIYTGQSFVNNNSALWALIDGHRKNYRHKIAHSVVMPDRKKTEEIINDFEKAIKYINSL